jgi:diguanylate cyclase (GGDEF)-like protein/PAS domain S-box-containing protein
VSIENSSSDLLSKRSIAIVVLAAVLATVYLVLPASTSADTIRVVAPAIGVGAILTGVAAHQPRRTLPWALIAVALGCQVAAYVLWSTLYWRGDDAFPSFAEGLHLASAILIAVAVALLSRGSFTEEDTFGSFEAVIVAIAFGVGVWLVVIEPYTSDEALSFADRAWAAIVPLIEVIALALALRWASRTGFSRSAPILIALGLLFQLIADLTRAALELRGEFMPGTLAAALAIIPPLVIASAALDRSMAPEPGEIPVATGPGFGRIVGLSVAALTPLTVLLALTISDLGSRTTRTIAGISAVIVVVLALTRMWALLAAVRSLTERRGQDRLAAMVEHSSDVVLLVDDVGDIRYASPGLASTLGHRGDDWIGRPAIDLVSNEDRDAARLELQRVVELGPGNTVKFEASLVRVDGQRRRMESTVANLLGGEAVDGVVATFRDVTEQRDLERQLSHRAFHDELTGLANRALFLDRMDHALRVARPESDPVVVLFVDLDDFKSVNDALGHGVGDQLLRAIADRIRRTSGSGDTPARLGGDEFAVLLEDRGGVDRALDVAEELLDSLRIPVSLAGYDLAVLASVGVAIAAPGMTTSSLLRDADIAMYEAKRAGKGQIKIFDPAMRLGATKHLEFRSELGNAIEDEQLRLVFQPTIDLRTGHVVGAEALLRWRHPTRGDIQPDEFIPIAERTGLILPIGKWVLDEAVRHAKMWEGANAQQVSVNVSAVQLRHPVFVDHVRTALADGSFDPDRLILEITETVLVDEIESASTILTELRSLGVRLAIDDFGTGYCSLSYLQRFPVDIVKIDRQFVSELGAGPRSSTLARMILQMTSSLAVKSVAEGIERPEQLAELRRLGCDIGQGFLLSRPLEADVICGRFSPRPARVPTGMPS